VIFSGCCNLADCVKIFILLIMFAECASVKFVGVVVKDYMFEQSICLKPEGVSSYYKAVWCTVYCGLPLIR